MNDLIFDRTQADVTDKTPKGYYNTSDLNRVESWCRYLADELNTAGYNINITTKTDWTTSDLRTASHMERIRTNIRSIMQGYHFITTIYSNADQFNYVKANNWEKILDEIYYLMWGMEDWYVYAEVSNAGQNRLWQHRYRQFFIPVRTKPYTELEYIESTGTQYIDTGITGGSIGTYEIKLNTLGTRTGAYEQYFAGKKTNPAIPKLYLNQTTVCTNIAGLYANTDSIHTIEVKNDGVYLDGTRTSTTSPGSWQVSFYLFSAHEENNLKSTMRLYYCKMWRDGILVRDFVPCLDDNDVACLYDKVSEEFFYNQGTGNFIAGQEV